MEPFEFGKEIDDMETSELRATLKDVSEKHNEQVDAFTDADYEAQVESLEDERDAAAEEASFARAFLSELVSEQKDMDAEVLADRFNVSELTDMATLEAPEAEEDGTDADPDDNKFSEKPEKSDNLPGEAETAEYRERARGKLAEMGIVSYDN